MKPSRVPLAPPQRKFLNFRSKHSLRPFSFINFLKILGVFISLNIFPPFLHIHYPFVSCSYHYYSNSKAFNLESFPMLRTTPHVHSKHPASYSIIAPPPISYSITPYHNTTSQTNPTSINPKGTVEKEKNDINTTPSLHISSHNITRRTIDPSYPSPPPHSHRGAHSTLKCTSPHNR